MLDREMYPPVFVGGSLVVAMFTSSLWIAICGGAVILSVLIGLSKIEERKKQTMTHIINKLLDDEMNKAGFKGRTPGVNNMANKDIEEASPMTNQEKIIEEVLVEREYQDNKYGGTMHDDRHNSHDWMAYITKHLGKAVTYPWRGDTFRVQMIRVAALAVAAAEWHDRGTNKPLVCEPEPRDELHELYKKTL